MQVTLMHTNTRVLEETNHAISLLPVEDLLLLPEVLESG
jgi:hypothetical protein